MERVAHDKACPAVMPGVVDTLDVADVWAGHPVFVSVYGHERNVTAKRVLSSALPAEIERVDSGFDEALLPERCAHRRARR